MEAEFHFFLRITFPFSWFPNILNHSQNFIHKLCEEKQKVTKVTSPYSSLLYTLTEFGLLFSCFWVNLVSRIRWNLCGKVHILNNELLLQHQ